MAHSTPRTVLLPAFWRHPAAPRFLAKRRAVLARPRFRRDVDGGSATPPLDVAPPGALTDKFHSNRFRWFPVGSKQGVMPGGDLFPGIRRQSARPNVREQSPRRGG
jgi:hypothetical protein